jgi:lipopolysaccharide export system permease protein
MRQWSRKSGRTGVLRLDRYLSQRFLAGLALALLVLLALFNLIALAEELEDVGQASFTLPDALWVTVLTTPKRIVELLPVTALLGGLLGLGAMANDRELIVIRAVGLSKRRIARTIGALAFVLCLGIVTLQFAVVPGLESEAAALRAQALQSADARERSGALWTRDGQDLIRIGGVRNDRALNDVEIYSTDATGSLVNLVQAADALSAGDNRWLLRDVLESRFQGAQVTETRRDTLYWNDLLSEETGAVLMLPLEALAPDDLVRTIVTLKRNQLDTHRYEIVLWQQVSLLPGLLAMSLLSLPFLLGSVRSVSAGQRVMIGGLVGISFYLLQQLSGQLAGLLGINPALVILAPSLILLAIAVGAIWQRDN